MTVQVHTEAHQHRSYPWVWLKLPLDIISHLFLNQMVHSTWGLNDAGQLGDGSLINRNTPTQIIASGVAQIAAGGGHSLILKTDGSSHTFGSNAQGQLGDGTNTSRNTPTQIFASGVAQIAAGYAHSLILKSDGSLHTFGMNSKGQLGDGTDKQQNNPTQILASGVAQIAAGHSHSLILKTDGSLWSFGDNYYGQLVMDQTLIKTHPLKFSLPGSLKLPQVLTTLLFLKRMDHYILLVRTQLRTIG